MKKKEEDKAYPPFLLVKKSKYRDLLYHVICGEIIKIISYLIKIWFELLGVK